VVVAVVVIGGPLYVGWLLAYGASPTATDMGYAPVQPLSYSHALHAGELGIDCRYCHTTVERAARAAVPPTQTCINCHWIKPGAPGAEPQGGVRANSSKLQLLREAYYGSDRVPAGLPIRWVRVHDLPDYAYFDHSAHVTRGVGCVTCHGRVDRMDVVYQAMPLSMSWCLECHRNPGPNLIPRDELAVGVTDMLRSPPIEAERAEYARQRVAEYNLRGTDYLTSCSTCHR
jgi:hypothetical protein